MKYGYNKPSGFRGEVVLHLWTDGRRSLPVQLLYYKRPAPFGSGGLKITLTLISVTP